ncbi:MAG: alanine--tRNA ligase, partial [Firmicutes bacterium]|nr:alanine--tRNA ligase [Bacillota bacterium]
MNSFTVDEIREMFLEFFREKDHRVLPSASLIPHDDPTLLLTVAGMVPFKRYFLGLEKPVYPRIATSQKCIRTDDIENVGQTDRHGTFFEMLGNFSFGDYFKKEIIAWSWEFVIDYLQFPAEKIWVSVYLDDDEAEEIWHHSIGLPLDRIVRLGKEDNFWETGAGPCGPCSEIYYDRGPEYSCGSSQCKPGCDCDRYVEFWNLVFIQFHQEGDKYIPLEAKSIDTGMGLERVAALLQGKLSIFEIDNILPVVEKAAEIAGVKYGQKPEVDLSLRVISDHARALTFLIGDGVLPSNEGRGYVLRRLLRRAIRHGRLLNMDKPFLIPLADLVIAAMGEAYPELREREDYIHKVVRLEEERFSQTLDQGMGLLQDLVSKAEQAGATEIAGSAVFQLYDTFGFPVELTREILEEHHLRIDEKGFQKAMEAQRERARQSRTAHGYLDRSLEVYKDLAGALAVEFSGYSSFEAQTELAAIMVEGVQVDQAAKGDRVAIIVRKTPFYAESGGQVGDQGFLISATGKARIEDVQEPVEGLIIHLGVVLEGFLTAGSEVEARIDQELRRHVARHHTATHLLHTVLKDVLGDHVNQAGSYVGPDRLRFDFTHFQAVTAQELEIIEDSVNKIILENVSIKASVTDLDTAKKRGAQALFGEKYGEEVRMIQVGDVSLELCGGTHVQATGEIGLFKIISESSIASGVRRIEALAGAKALQYVRNWERVLASLEDRLPGRIEELPEQIDSLMQQNKDLEKELAAFKQRDILSRLDPLLAQAEKINGISLLASEVEVDNPEDLRKVGDYLRDKLSPALILLGARRENKVLFLSMVSKPLEAKGFHAGQVVKAAAKVCGGGGGGR